MVFYIWGFPKLWALKPLHFLQYLQSIISSDVKLKCLHFTLLLWVRGVGALCILHCGPTRAQTTTGPDEQ